MLKETKLSHFFVSLQHAILKTRVNIWPTIVPVTNIPHAHQQAGQSYFMQPTL